MGDSPKVHSQSTLEGEDKAKHVAAQPKATAVSHPMSKFGQPRNSSAAEKDIEPVAYTKVELTVKQKQDIKEAFNAFDVEGTGFMSTTDLKVALRALGFEPRKSDIRKIIAMVDRTDTGRLCFTDFLEIISAKMSEKDTKEEIMKAFKLFDRDQTGKITVENLQDIANGLGEGLSEEEIKEMIEEADLNGDGTVNQDEFFRIMKKTSLY